jgi:hypothetical protein
MFANNPDPFTQAVCKATGLKNLRKVSIIMEANCVTVIEAEFYAEDLTILTKQFVLSAEPIEDESTSAIDA